MSLRISGQTLADKFGPSQRVSVGTMPSADSSAYRPQRPPGVSVKSFHWLAPGLPAPHSGWLWASRSRGRLPKGAGLIPDSCTSHPIFAFSFLRIPPRGGHPCFRLQDSDHHGSSGTWSSAAPHPLDLTHARHTRSSAPSARKQNQTTNNDSISQLTLNRTLATQSLDQRS